MSGIYKGISGLALFACIPLLINYLGDDNYGVWVLVFTLFQWVLMMDFGIQSSLKTKIPVLLHDKKIDLLKSYIKSTYKISSYIALGIFVLFILLIYTFDFRSGLNITFHSEYFVNKIFIINVFFFCVNFIANVHKSLYVAFLKGKYTEQSIALNQLGFLILIVVAVTIFPDIEVENKLILVSLLNGLFCLLINIAYTIKFFKLEKLDLITYEKKPLNFIKEIFKMGAKFMVIQLGMMFVFTADSYIIANNFSPKLVMPYDIVSKLFQLPILIFFAALSPFWSMFANDYINKNHIALLGKFKKFNLAFIGITLFVVLFALTCPYIISLWIKERIEIPDYLIAWTCVAALFRIFITFYSFFLYGSGHLNKFLTLIIISIILKLPISYIFINLHFGVNSVVISTFIIVLTWIIIVPLECFSIINKLKKNE